MLYLDKEIEFIRKFVYLKIIPLLNKDIQEHYFIKFPKRGYWI